MTKVKREQLKRGLWRCYYEKSENRFEVVLEEGSQLKDKGLLQILVDKETGVNYITWHAGYAGSITPFLDFEGKVVITK